MTKLFYRKIALISLVWGLLYLIWLSILIEQNGCGTSLACPCFGNPQIVGNPGMKLMGLCFSIQFFLIRTIPSSWLRTCLLFIPTGFATWFIWILASSLAELSVSEWIDFGMIRFSVFDIDFFWGSWIGNSLGMFVSLFLVGIVTIWSTSPRDKMVPERAGEQD